MKLPRLLAALCSLALGLAAFAQPAALTPAPEAATPRTYTAAIVVSNRADAGYDEKISALEDLLSARLSNLGIHIISREIVTSGLRAFTPPSAPVTRDPLTATTSAAAARSPDGSVASASATTIVTGQNPAAAAEAAFIDQSSALRLAQNLGADYLIHASIISFGQSTRTVQAQGVNLKSTDHTLRVAYKLLDAQAGGALAGDVVKVTRSEQRSATASSTVTFTLDDLLDEAGEQITSSLRARIAAGRIAAARPAAKAVTITLAVEAADLFIPDVRIGAENVVSVGESKLKVTPLNATVEVDGVAVGTAPGKITLKPGFARLRLSREGFQPWERTINAVEGQTLAVAMTMSEAGLARFKESTAWINELKNDAKLTDAEVKVLEGKAKSLENSFFKVDTKENFRFILPDRYQELEVNQQNTTINN